MVSVPSAIGDGNVGMRWTSTPESAHKGELTKLAVIECVIAVALYVSAGFYFGTFQHLLWAIAVAPLMLFRTAESAKWGLDVYKRINKWGLTDERFRSAWKFVAFTWIVAFAGPLIRLVATAYWAVRRPIETIKQVPANWVRQSFATDLAHPPEVLPTEALFGGYDVPDFKRFLEAVRGSKWYLAIAVFLPFIVAGYLPSLLYRASFKATSIAYVPFIWVVRTTVGRKDSLKTQLEDITKGVLEKARRNLSVIVASAAAGKALFALGWLDLADLTSKFPSAAVVENVVLPGKWPWWQVSLGVDALLTGCLFVYADFTLRRLETPDAWNEGRVGTTVQAVSFTRACLSLIIMGYFGWLAWANVLAGL